MLEAESWSIHNLLAARPVKHARMHETNKDQFWRLSPPAVHFSAFCDLDLGAPFNEIQRLLDLDVFNAFDESF